MLNIDSAAKDQLCKILCSHRSAFSNQPGQCYMFTYEIKVNIDGPIVKRPLVPRDQVRKQVPSWLEQGIIEPTISPHHHPLLIVRRNQLKSEFVLV